MSYPTVPLILTLASSFVQFKVLEVLSQSKNDVILAGSLRVPKTSICKYIYTYKQKRVLRLCFTSSIVVASSSASNTNAVGHLDNKQKV